MKNILLITLGMLFAMSVNARSVVLGSGGDIANSLLSISTTSSFATTSGNGYSRSTGSASTHAVSTATTHARACPQMGHAQASTGIWGRTAVSGSNYSRGSGSGSVVANAYTEGSTVANAWNEGSVSYNLPAFEQSWNGASTAQASNDMQSGSSLEVGRNSAAGAKTSLDGTSYARGEWSVGRNAFGISDKKTTDTRGGTVAWVSSWKEGHNVVSVDAGAAVGNFEKATADVEGWTWNGGWD